MFGLEKLFRRKDPTVAEVAQALLPRLKALRPAVAFSFDPALEVIRGSDGGVISLANLHLDYLRARPEQREAMLATFAQGVLPADLPSTFDEARPQLLPALRNLPGLDQSRLIAGEGTLDALTQGMRPFSGMLRVAVVHDTEHAMQQVGAEVLQRWGVDVERLHEVAIDNLRHKAAPSFQPLSPGLYASAYGDYYDAARILLPELAWQLGLPGTPVAMVPNRICLLLAGDADAPALRAMVAKSREILGSESRPLAAEMFRLQDGRWQAWTPHDAEAARALHELQAGMLSSDYAAQKQVLDDLHRRSGTDVFVATHTLVQRQDGRLVSYSVLARGALTWLPRSDVVIFVDPADPQAPRKVVAWADFEQGLAPLLEVLPCVPPRYRLREPPSDALIAALPESAL